MPNKEIHPQWMFVIVGLFVAFCVMVVLWWNARSEEKIATNYAWNEGYAMLQMQKQDDKLKAYNDSLYKENDSLKRSNVYLRTAIDKSSTITVGGDMIKGDKIVNH